MKILIVYEEVPESTKFYSVDVTDKDWTWLRLTHGHFVNSVTSDKAAESACLRLMTWLESRAPFEPGTPVKLDGFDWLVHTGFIL